MCARATKNVNKPQSQMCESCKIFVNQNRNIFGFGHNLILRFAIVQNKSQQTNKTTINHVNDNHIKFEVSLHFGGSGLLCTRGAWHKLILAILLHKVVFHP